MSQDPIASPSNALPASPVGPNIEAFASTGKSSREAAEPVPNERTEAALADDPQAADVPDDSDESLGLTAGDRLFAATTGFCIVAMIIAPWARLTGWGAREVEIERQSSQHFVSRLDVNSATWVEIAELEGIGPVLARRIVTDRTENGPFTSVDALRRVSGIGPKTLDKLRPLVAISSTAAETQTPPRRTRPEPASKSP